MRRVTKTRRDVRKPILIYRKDPVYPKKYSIESRV